MAEIFVAKAEDMADGDRRIVRTGKGEVGVFRHKGAFHAYANRCVHSGGPACEGILIPKVIELIAEDKTYQGQTFSDDEMHFVCPWHGYEYNIQTGVFAGDSKLKLKKFEIVERSGDVYVVA
jgi:nitrite reductase/ring-hydroxylating ferredoxin subunit